MNYGRPFAKRLMRATLAIAFTLSLAGCQSNQSQPQVVLSPAEQQKLKDEQEKTQKQMDTLTSGFGQTLSKTPKSPSDDPAAEWRRMHPRKQPAARDAAATKSETHP